MMRHRVEADIAGLLRVHSPLARSGQVRDGADVHLPRFVAQSSESLGVLVRRVEDLHAIDAPLGCIVHPGTCFLRGVGLAALPALAFSWTLIGEDVRRNDFIPGRPRFLTE